MSSKYKQVANGKGTDLTIGSGKYISVGKNGIDVTIRGNGRVIAFNTWEDFVNAIDVKASAYFKDDEERENKEKEENTLYDVEVSSSEAKSAFGRLRNSLLGNTKAVPSN